MEKVNIISKHETFKEDLEKLYLYENKTIGEIANVLNISVYLVSQYLDRCDIRKRAITTRRNNKYRNPNLISLLKNKENFKNILYKLYIEDIKTMSEVAKELNISISQVKIFIRKFNIQARNKGFIRGKRGANWKGGKHLHNGYVEVWKPEHPRSRKRYIYEHILIAEEMLGRQLIFIRRNHPDNEIVHHINGIRNDNRKENLKIMKQSEHIKEHFANKINISYGTADKIASKICELKNVTKQQIISILTQEIVNIL